jgi:hypothetical protein
LAIAIGAAKIDCAETGFVEPENIPVSKPGLLRVEYYHPGDLGFDPFGLKPDDAEEVFTMQTKELQNGRVAILVAAGFLAQELVNRKEIIENLLA